MNQQGKHNFFYGHHHTEETKKLISEMKKGNKNANWRGGITKPRRKSTGMGHNQFGERNPFYGKKHTEESLRKMRLAKLGKHHTDETKRKQSLMHIGEKNPNFGKHISEERKQTLRKIHLGLHPSEQTRKNMSISQKGRKHTEKTKLLIGLNSKKNWQTEEIAKKMLLSMLIKPNGKELYLDYILQTYFPDEWEFVGDGQKVIDGLCPDFINVNGKQQIIELFGDYWHNRKNMKYHQTEEGRKEAFAKEGYSTLIIWEHELADENKVIEKIKLFSER